MQPKIGKFVTGSSNLRLLRYVHLSFQIISQNPACILDAETCQKTNDQLFQAVKLHLSRFAGFSILPM